MSDVLIQDIPATCVSEALLHAPPQACRGPGHQTRRLSPGCATLSASPRDSRLRRLRVRLPDARRPEYASGVEVTDQRWLIDQSALVRPGQP